MRPRYLLLTAFVVAILVTILVMNAGAFQTPGISPSTLPRSNTENVRAERPEVQAGNTVPAAVTFKRTGRQDAPALDGASLLRTHCSQCHLVQRFEQSNRARADWEKALSRMEEIGVQLSDTERKVLLDYLVVRD